LGLEDQGAVGGGGVLLGEALFGEGIEGLGGDVEAVAGGDEVAEGDAAVVGFGEVEGLGDGELDVIGEFPEIFAVITPALGSDAEFLEVFEGAEGESGVDIEGGGDFGEGEEAIAGLGESEDFGGGFGTRDE